MADKAHKAQWLVPWELVHSSTPHSNSHTIPALCIHLWALAYLLEHQPSQCPGWYTLTVKANYPTPT